MSTSGRAASMSAWPFSSLAEVPARWRAEAPDDIALITERGTLSAAAFADLVDTQVAALDESAPVGSRVAVHAPNTAAFAALLYAVPAAHRQLVPLNVRLGDTAKADQLRRTGAALLLGDPVEGFDGPTLPLGSLAAPGSASTPIDQSTIDPAAVAWVIFTSGSTGRPKGVLVTHGSLAAAVETTAAARPLTDDEVYLYPFPLFHIAAYNVVHAHVRRRPVVLLERFDAHRLLELTAVHQVTAMSLTTTMLHRILEVLTDPDAPPVPATLRTIAYGAAPLPRALLEEADRVLGCDFAQGYGMTELSGNAVFLGPEAHRRGLAGETRFTRAAGCPGPGVRLRIVDDAGHRVGSGTRGEITVAADQVCAGYLDDATATAHTIRNGWLHTGDVGVVDDDGLLRVVDRAKDIVVTGGENVASREVEDILGSHARVAQAAVIGLPDERWGEAVTACVVLRGRSTPQDEPVRAEAGLTEDLRAHVADRLASFAKPRRIFVFAELPTNAAGKVDKPALRAQLGETGMIESPGPGRRSYS